jgi:hypothetical protein
MAIVGTIVYGASAARYWRIFHRRWTLLPAAVIACFLLLSEALIGVAATGERKWHASWWEWHGLILTVCSGGSLATVHTNQAAMAITTAIRGSFRWRITSGAISGRTSTNADPAAKTALTSNPTGMAT